MTRVEVIDHTWTDDPSSDQLVDQLGQLVIFHQGHHHQTIRGRKQTTEHKRIQRGNTICSMPVSLMLVNFVESIEVGNLVGSALGRESNYDNESSYDGAKYSLPFKCVGSIWALPK